MSSRLTALILCALLAPAFARASATPAPTTLPDCQFTNELGRAVRLSDFHGQALAITFFYTRCANPTFCPRLSKNFQEASAHLAAITNAPGNWHFLSVTFDPHFDTPDSLKAYAESYNYDPAHWSLLTGSPEQIGQLAHAFGVAYKDDSGMINHNFRTVIVDATGRIQMIFPTGGNLSDQIVEQMLKAAIVTAPLAQNHPITK